MNIKLSVICSCFLVATSVRADIMVKLDTSFAESVLADVCSNDQIDETSIRSSEAVIDMLAHFRQFRDYFTMDAYVAARQLAADCTKSDRDIFRFNDVIDNKAGLTAEVEAMKNDQQGYSAQMTAMLAPYVPENVSYNGRATIAIGTPSCGGWSVNTDFYVDLPCITGDRSGLQYLFAHESYHGMQDQFMPVPDAEDPLAQLFNHVMREGSATAIADFSKIEEGGSYTAKSKQSIRRNAARRQLNFDLLDMSVAYLVKTPTASTFDIINNIGLSGSFDAPFYDVGATIFRAVEKADGQTGLLCLLRQQPQAIFGRYAVLSSQEDDLPVLGGATLAVLDQSSGYARGACAGD